MSISLEEAQPLAVVGHTILVDEEAALASLHALAHRRDAPIRRGRRRALVEA